MIGWPGKYTRGANVSESVMFLVMIMVLIGFLALVWASSDEPDDESESQGDHLAGR